MNDTEDRSSKAKRFSQAHKDRAKGMMRDRMGNRPDKRAPQRGAEVRKDYAGPQRPRQVQAPDQEGGGRPGRRQHRETIKERIQAMRARKQERRQARG